jgi:hypothetical protein
MTKDPIYNYTREQKTILEREGLLTKGHWAYRKNGAKIMGSYYGTPVGFCERCNGFVYGRLPFEGLLRHICQDCIEDKMNDILVELGGEPRFGFDRESVVIDEELEGDVYE